jgi:Rrf2 family protein
MAQPTNTRFSLAVHLLTLLAQEPDKSVDSTALSQSPATNPVHVRRVLGQLREVGLVRSQSGAHGGWVLARSPDEIDLGQVWRAVNSDDPILGFHSPDPDCPTGQLVSSNLRALDRRAFEVLVEELSRVSVADVVTGAPVARV